MSAAPLLLLSSRDRSKSYEKKTSHNSSNTCAEQTTFNITLLLDAGFVLRFGLCEHQNKPLPAAPTGLELHLMTQH